jgi:hypothetical protein
MALAILELLDYDDDRFEFQIDTGTNAYYQLRAGTGVRRDVGIDLVEDVYFTTPVARNETGGDLFRTSREISVPARHFDRRDTYAQLVSFKTADRRSPAVSRAIRVPAGFKGPPRAPSDYAASFSGTTAMNGTQYHSPRRIACKTAETARQASLDEVLGAVLKLAGPVIQDLLKGGTTAGAAGGAAQTPAEIVAVLLKSLLGSVPGGGGQAAVSQQKSLVGGSRFSRPFVFGIDDALIGAAIGQLVQVLPQLANAANQKRIELRKADNQLTAGILSDINKRLMMEKLAELQKQPQAAASITPEQLNQLLALLQQAPGAGATPPPTEPSTTKSLNRRSYTFSNRATLTFETAEPVDWNGSKRLVFLRGQRLVLKVRLNVGDPVPKTALPKALLRVAWKDSSEPAVQFEKTFKHKDVAAGAALECVFEPGELAHLPAGALLAVVAELRWLTAKGSEVRALGSTEIVLVNRYFVKGQGTETGGDIELRDLNLHRPFWCKVWEAPVLDAASATNGRKNYMWQLDVNLRYSVLVTGSHESNGLMETKLLQGPRDPDSLTQKTDGRMKAGIELSLAELNKLQKLWNLDPIDAPRLEAFAAPGFLKQTATEFIRRLTLKGKAGQQGMVWVIPVFKMFGFKLVTASRVDESGQAIATAEEDTHFPLPVAARVIGLKGKDY